MSIRSHSIQDRIARIEGRSDELIDAPGDVTRLPYATGLGALEKKLAWNMNAMAETLPGVQQTRQLMGHMQFGARIDYGDCLFFTFSPNPQHSGLVLRLSRYRRNDPFLDGDDRCKALSYRMDDGLDRTDGADKLTIALGRDRRVKI